MPGKLETSRVATEATRSLSEMTRATTEATSPTHGIAPAALEVPFADLTGAQPKGLPWNQQGRRIIRHGAEREPPRREDAKGKAEAILTVLEARGMEVTASLRERVLTCTEGATLDTWLVRAVSATTARDVLE